ncbi:MAG TPA: ADP-L-glycero-D-mannoheptose-6-epimerase, partial [Flavobacteriales bacterium]|nr:ADP-L-glycero-D-mannoheptose-6-epimerase [Flavobacteriales bacterium]
YQYFTEADLTKLRNAGYSKEFTSLEDGVQEYVVNYLANLRS